MRFSMLLSARREYSRATRWLLAALALLQLIAPTWHVCEMGGARSCCEPKTAALQHCAHTSTPVAKPRCSHCPQPDASPSNSGSSNFSSSALRSTPASVGENCLAKLLIGMPLQFAPPPLQIENSIARRAFAAREYFYCDSFIAALPPARAPPVFS